MEFGSILFAPPPPPPAYQNRFRIFLGLSSNGKLPMGALSGGNEAINAAIASDNPVTFFEAKNADAENEKMPEVKEITAQQRRASVTTRDAYISELTNKQQSGGRGSLPPESSPKIKTNGEKIPESENKDKKKLDKKWFRIVRTRVDILLEKIRSSIMRVNVSYIIMGKFVCCSASFNLPPYNCINFNCCNIWRLQVQRSCWFISKLMMKMKKVSRLRLEN